MELVARIVVEIGAREDGWWECVWPGTNTEHITFGNSHIVEGAKPRVLAMVARLTPHRCAPMTCHHPSAESSLRALSTMKRKRESRALIYLRLEVVRYEEAWRKRVAKMQGESV